MNYACALPSQPCMPINFIPDRERACGEEFQVLTRNLGSSMEHYFFPFSTQWNDPLLRFTMLAATWKYETEMLSSVSDVILNRAYQQIIAMGHEAIPYILSQMQIHRDHWFWALEVITGENPILSEHRGDMRQMTEDWLKWGREHGYIK